ncbi:threonine--tRNA ligase [Fusobacterium sp. PH5-44]|uniref:threonine--tRNA ligase n=1 Tax=unclassified Fusobacterium TaxID=2648384 RepID=UPI003D2051BA
MKITFEDGSIKEYENGINLFVIGKDLGNNIAKEAVAGKIDGIPVDMSTVLDRDAKVEFILRNSPEGEEILRHSTAHLMAQAVVRLFPETKVAIGPAIENGFYYDFDPKEQFTEDDLPKIEAEMKKIVKENLKLQKKEMTREEAIKYFENLGEIYKVEIIKEIAQGEILSFYEQGNFIDLCRGPHVPSTSYLKSFKLRSVAGAYWCGDSNNKMLQRIYGYAFSNDERLKEFLIMLEEAEKRDHRKLGKELDLFMLSEYGPGFPFWLPKGMALRMALENFWKDVHIRAGYEFIQTPIMLNKELWEVSGHWFNYRENMYTSSIDDHVFAIKPMNCPGGMLVYKHNIHSYKDLPIRTGEFGLVHRHEASGALSGLFRVRAFTQDDAHIFMREDQITEEIANVILLYKKVYGVFNLNFNIELSTRPEDKYIGDISTWDNSEKALALACEKAGFEYKINPGDGAFYGPKLDFKLRDSMNRIWQCGTIQLDMNLPERFDLNYIAEDGSKKRPVMVHRALFGSIERFVGILIEHYAGAFPLWLAPVQVKILTLNDDVTPYAKKIKNMLIDNHIRVELDDRAESIGYKIREANGKYKIPVQLIIGQNEVNNEEVSIRRFGSKDQNPMKLNEFMNLIKEESILKYEK